TFSILAALLFGPAAGALLVALDGLVLTWRFRISSLTPGRVAFNVTSLALAMWLSARLFFALVHGQPLAIQPSSMGRVVGPLAVFAGCYFVLNTGLVAGAATIGRQTSLYRAWRQHFLPLRLTGWTGAQAGGREAEEVLRLEPIATGANGHAGTEASGSPREYVLVRRDGSTRAIEQTYAGIRDEDNEIEGVIRTFRDISQRKAVEAERQALLDRQEEARAAADAASRS